MNNHDFQEFLQSQKEPIKSCESLTKHFIGKHKTIPVYLTPAFEKEFNNKMTELARLQEENLNLKEEIKELDFLVGLRQKRGLISRFDREFNEEDKIKNPNRSYVGIMPDAEEVYKRYYDMKEQQKVFIKWLEKEIDIRKSDIDKFSKDYENYKVYYLLINDLKANIEVLEEAVCEYKKIIGCECKRMVGETSE